MQGLNLDEFQFTIFSHDYYMIYLPNIETYPHKTQSFLLNDLGYKYFSDYKNRRLKIAPVIRLYGTNNYGQKCCVHVHGYFPYFYVKVEEIKHLLTPDFIREFGDCLEKCYNGAYGNPQAKNASKVAQEFQNDSARNPFIKSYIIYSIEVVDKLDFYGYHSRPEKFFKIKVYDPKYVKPLSKILSQPIIMNRRFQAYEAHFSYFVHFYSDCNIFGMSEMTMMNFKFRKNFDEGKMRNFQKIFVEKAFRSSFDYFTQMFDLIDLQEIFPDKFSNLTKTSTSYVELDIYFENIINKIINELREANFFTQTPEKLFNTAQTQEIFYVRITKALLNWWNDEIERRKDMGIKDSTTFYINYSNNVEENPKSFQLFSGSQDIKFHEILPCNFIWDLSYRQKLINHIKNFYESIENMQQENKEEAKEITINEMQIASFPALLQHEKNAMVTMMTSRFAEWNRRAKENKRLKPLIMRDMADELDAYMEEEDDEFLKEEVKNIESSTTNIKGPKQQQQIGPKKIKLTKNYTVPDIAFCAKCLRDVYSCTCERQTQQQKEIEEKLKSQEMLSLIEKRSLTPEEMGKKEYTYIKKPPSLKEILDSQKSRAIEHIPQQPFFDNAKDFLEHYKLKPVIPSKSLDYSSAEKMVPLAEAMNKLSIQYLTSTMLKDSIPTIKDSEKFPLFMRFYPNYELRYAQRPTFIPEPRTYKYTKKPPSLKTILESNTPGYKDKTSNLFRDNSKNTDYYSMISPLKNSVDKDKEVDQKLSKKSSSVDISLLGFEVFARSRPNLLPNPDLDPINALIFNLSNEKVKYSDVYENKKITGVIMVDEQDYPNVQDFRDKIKIYYKLNEFDEALVVKEEKDLINAFIALVFKFDPDIVYGYDVEKTSVFYLAIRAMIHNIDVMNYISRAPRNIDDIFTYLSFENVQFDESTRSFINDNAKFISDNKKMTQFVKLNTKSNNKKNVKVNRQVDNRWTQIKNYTLNFNISGRVLINVWRIAEFELKLKNYSLESVIFHLFKKREPVFSNWTLTQWWDESRESRSRTLNYIRQRLIYTEEILNRLNTIPLTVEMTKLYGIDFDSVLVRGSQFKVEAILIRVTKSNNYLLLTASKLQVAHQKMLQCVPLILEPPKQLYVDPVIVLDFQSLYPSLMIAYNYCFSTCLGSIEDLFIAGTKRMGVYEFTNPDFKHLFGDKPDLKEEDLISKIIISPNKVAFVRKEVQLGIIPRILQEFLNTRIMIKKSMRYYDKFDFLKRLLTSRQTALKLFMNVVYGYTGASFSGRMPCSDIADAVVETGKYILKSSIKHIEEHKEWRAHVIYGDTDSMFVLLKGRSVEQAMDIGNAMAIEITKMHPYPIELKFEKVYCPFIPLAKKRYTGYKHEKKGEKPTLEGKGLETVRRDGVEACVKIMQKCLIELFQTRNVSALKDYLHKQWSKILKGHINLKDFIFAREVRLGTYVSMPPAALVSIENTKKDPMLAPKYRERVEYIVISGKEGSRVKDLVVSPADYIKKHNYKLNSRYYIENVINNALNRIFEAFKIDIQDWYMNIPKGLNKVNLLVNEIHFMGSTTREHIPKSLNYNLEKYYRLQVCILCFEQAENLICQRCASDPQTATILSLQKMKFIEREYNNLEGLCRACSKCVMNGVPEVPCENVACNVFYSKIVAKDKVYQINKKLQQVVDALNK